MKVPSPRILFPQCDFRRCSEKSAEVACFGKIYLSWLSTTFSPKFAPHYAGKTIFGGEETMLWTLFVILLIAWILGLVGTYQIGAFVWLLLVAAVIVLILQLVTGRRPVV